MGEFIKKYKFILGGLILIISGIIFQYYNLEKETETTNYKEELVLVEDKEEDSIEEEKEELVDYQVDIKGEVKNPGVYHVKETDRVNDVIKLAGGLLKNADTSLINLSKKVFDEMVIIINTKTETKKLKTTTISNDASITTTNTNQNSGVSSTNSKVSINSGTQKELETLTGIGAAKAIAIIEYRNKNGGFKTLEELKQVSGIGDSTYDKIKDNITL